MFLVEDVSFCFRFKVNNNGHLTFDQPLGSFTPVQFNNYGRDIIAPFWTDIDNSGTGTISYNQYTSGSVLSRATRDINQYFPGVNFTASWVFVATWDKVAYFNNSGTVRCRALDLCVGVREKTWRWKMKGGKGIFLCTFFFICKAQVFCGSSYFNGPAQYIFLLTQNVILAGSM